MGKKTDKNEQNRATANYSAEVISPWGFITIRSRFFKAKSPENDPPNERTNVAIRNPANNKLELLNAR